MNDERGAQKPEEQPHSPPRLVELPTFFDTPDDFRDLAPPKRSSLLTVIGMAAVLAITILSLVYFFARENRNAAEPSVAIRTTTTSSNITTLECRCECTPVTGER